jgi:hypothetical protein
MERQKDQAKELTKDLKEKTDKELEALRLELARLKKLKAEKEKREKTKQKELSASEELIEEQEPEESTEVEISGLEEIEQRLESVDKYLTEEITRIDQKTYERNAEYIESQLQSLEREIVGEIGVIEEELSPYEKILEEYPWLEEERYQFMYFIPNKEKNPNDYESWKNEWAKVMYDYARYAILHILHLRELLTEKPFANFENRKRAIKEIAEELIDQGLAKWLSKKEEKLRIYWKTLDLWADEIYDWAYELGKLEPIVLFEIRQAKEEFSTLPKEDLEEIFEILSKNNRGKLIKLDNGEIGFKIKLV